MAIWGAPERIPDSKEARAMQNAMMVVESADRAANRTRPPEEKIKSASCIAQAATPEETEDLAAEANSNAILSAHIALVIGISKRAAYIDCKAR